MTALLLENFKLIVLFVFIGFVIGLSHLSGGKTTSARGNAHRQPGAPVPAGR